MHTLPRTFRRWTHVVAAAALVGAAAAAGARPPSRTAGEAAVPAAQPPRTMRRFGSQAAFTRFLHARRAARERWMREHGGPASGKPGELPSSVVSPAVSLSQAVVAKAADTGAAESVTNVQHAGVDEGGIVKVHGGHLVVLRRGRLFTVAVGDGDLRPVSTVDAYAPGMDPDGAWYDEMLISGDVIAVIGYSYRRTGTEINLFSIDAAGRLAYRSTYHLRSGDYYSSRNYASRLVAGKLVFYAPLEVDENADPAASLPALRRWHPGAGDGEFRPIIRPAQLYLPERPIDPGYGLVLHTVTTCDPAGGELRCTATAVVGGWSESFYVSPSAVYVWLGSVGDDMEDEPRRDARRDMGMLYRMPLDGSAPSALGVAGTPVDQLSFLESGDGHLNVLVQAEGRGSWMWRAERSAGGVALMRVPLSAFGDGAGSAPRRAYRTLGTPESGVFQNRFVGRWLLYGSGGGWGRPAQGGATLYAVPWAGGPAARIALPHGVDRIEQMGADAVVVGSAGQDLRFSGVRLEGVPRVRAEYRLPQATQGETRSHGFLYRPDGAATGTLGLPVARQGRPGYAQLTEGSAAIVYVRNTPDGFAPLGELQARPERAVADGCRASCVDWYGNARPLFLRGRVFALLGYELVEGREEDGRIREVQRVSFAPTQATAQR